MSLLGRLVSGTILVLILAIGVLVWAAEGTLRRDLEHDLAGGLEREARLIAAALPTDSVGARAAVHRFSHENGHRITLIDTLGHVLAESGVPDGSVSAMENHLHRPEVQAALAGRVGTDIRMSATFGVMHLYVAVAGGPGVVRVAAPYDQVDVTVHRAQAAVAWAAILALGAGLLLALFAGRAIARPLTEITQAANAIAAGRPPRFPHSGIPDVDELVAALRMMHEQSTDRFEQLRREQAETSAVIGSMVEGVVAADARGQVVTANAALRRLLGYRDDEPLPELPQLFRAKGARDVVDAVMRGEPIDGRELELEGRTLLATARPLPQGGVVLVLHDLTEIRRLEAVRRDFVANVSHELKTPLTSISGYAETLVSDKPDAATAERFLGVILGNARRMQRLVDSLLDLSRIESGSWRPTVEQVDVGIVARETWAGLAARAATAGIGFEFEAPGGRPALIDADVDALRQVLTNLFDNALRYTPRGGRVVCRFGRADGGNVVSVADTGSGIPREHLSRVFERFYRADPSRSRDEGGTGLGLSIVKHLVNPGSVTPPLRMVGTSVTPYCVIHSRSVPHFRQAPTTSTWSVTMHRWNRGLLMAALAAATMTGGELAAQATATPAAPQVTVGGVGYTQWGYNLSGGRHLNAFDVTRAYININAKFAGGVSLRITPDVYRQAATPDSALGYRLKYAYLAYAPGAGKVTYKLGMIQTPWLSREEDLWDYRMQGQMAVERYAGMSSADLGVSADTKLAGGRLDLNVGVYNGEGYKKPEGDQRKDLEIRASYLLGTTDETSAFGGFRLSGYAQVGHPTGGGTRNRFLGMLSYKTTQYTLAAEYEITKDSAAASPAVTSGSVLSAFGVYRLANSKVAVIGRVDVGDPDTDVGNNKTTGIIAGASYQASPNLRFLGDVDLTSLEAGNPKKLIDGRNKFLLQAQFTF
ncbi:MAG: hypothetical protein JF590_06015 [Gemmatimonadetes bacterium]|nr:hypothetical protein [Gemmatimonadota bacterium]